MISTIEQAAGREVMLAQIETGCRNYETESANLEQQIADLEFDLEAVKQKHLRAIKRQAGVVANCEAELHSLVEAAPGLFTKPRTITVHGVKVGFTFSEGKLCFEDEDMVIALIKKHYEQPDAAMFIRVKEEVNKDALKNLDAKALAKLGCNIDGAGDIIVLKRVSGEVENLINKLIKKLASVMIQGE